MSSVGFLIDRWEPDRGGAERALAQLAVHLEERGHDVHVFGLRAEAGAPGCFHQVETSLLQRMRRSTHERALAARLVAAAKEAGCDVTLGIRHLTEVDLYWPHDGSHLGALEGRARARGRDVRPYGRHKVFLELEKKLLAEGGARRIACVSELVRDELARFYPACVERLELAPNGIDTEAFHPRNRGAGGARLRRRLEVPEGMPLVVFAGRDPLRKGLPELFRALETLRTEDWRLLVAGARHPARWRRIAARHGLQAPRVLVEGHLSAPELFAAADLVCIPTWRDACLLAVLEALASGTPVVTTQYAGAATVVVPASGTVLEDPGDAQAASAAIRTWLDRIRRGDVDREAARACVDGRGLEPWLGRLEELLTELAA